MNKQLITYYTLRRPYKSDISGVTYVTKNCGLKGTEIDENFHFLRGSDLESVEIDPASGELVFSFVNEEKFITSGFGDYISSVYDKRWTPSSLSGSSYDSENGILNLLIDGEKYEIGGFYTDNDFVVYVGDGISGKGVVCDPVRIMPSDKTGVFAPVSSVIDYRLGNTLKNADIGKRYLTIEPVSKYALLYSKDDILKISGIVSGLNNGWRVATFDDWANTLNLIECDEVDRTHGTKEEGSYGKEAGFAIKDESWEEDVCGNDTLNILPKNGTLNQVSYLDPFNDLVKIFDKGTGKVKSGIYSEEEKYSARLVYEGVCPLPITIDGVKYNPVLAISGDTKLWADIDIVMTSLIYDGDAVIPESGTDWKYFVNEYDPVSKKWVKTELKNNYSVIIESFEGRENEEVLNDGGTLVFKHDKYVNAANDYTDSEIAKEAAERKQNDAEIRDLIEHGAGEVSELIEKEKRERISSDEEISTKLSALSGSVIEFSGNVENSISEIKNEISAITGEFDTKISAATDEFDTKLNAVTDEFDAKISAVTDEFDAKISVITGEFDAKISAVTDEFDAKISAVTGSLTDEINNERIERESEDNVILSALSEEYYAREEADRIITEALEDETNERIENERLLDSAITMEKEERIDADNYILSAITNEVSNREASENEIRGSISELSSRTIVGESAITVTNGVSEGEKVVKLKIADSDKQILFQNGEGLKTELSLAYDSSGKTIDLIGINGTISSIDAADFIKDGMLDHVEVNYDSAGTPVLYFYFNDESGKGKEPLEVRLDSLIYEAGNGIKRENNVFSINKNEASEEFLIVDRSGIRISGVTSAINSAKSIVSADTHNEFIKVQKSEFGEGGTLYNIVESGLTDRLDYLQQEIDDIESSGGTGEIRRMINELSATTGEIELTVSSLTEDIANKVDKEDGKGLSENDFTDADKDKLSGIEDGAQENIIEKIVINGEEADISGKTASIDITIPSNIKVESGSTDYLEINEETNEISFTPAGLATKEETTAALDALELKTDNLRNDVNELVTKFDNLETEIQDTNNRLSAVTSVIGEEVDRQAEDINTLSSITEWIIEELDRKDDGVITSDITVEISGETYTLAYSGDTVSDALQKVSDFFAENVGGGEGKIKDVIINGKSVYNEESGNAILNIVTEQNSPLEIDFTENTLSISFNGIFNNTIDLS